MTPTLHIQLLGHFHLTADQTPVTTLDSPRLQAVLAYLVLQRTSPQRRAHLAFQLWPDTTEAQAHGNLRTLLHRLRQALPNADEFLHVDAQTVRWRPDAPYMLDVADFEHTLTQAEAADRAADHAGMRAAFMHAAELYRGDLLPGWYDDWVLIERERLRQAFLTALERLVLLLEQQQDYLAAIGYAQRLLRHDPLHEVTYQHLMGLHAASGDRASALRVYHTCATVLERELGVEPSPDTRAAYARLVSGDSLLARPLVSAPADLPTGTVTFLFTDIEGSTRLWEQHTQAMPAALARHDAILREAIATHAGVVFRTVGDAICAAFARAPDALNAAVAAQRALQNEPWAATGLPQARPVRVRMALHTGVVETRGGDYVGHPLNRLARILATGHGGQMLLSHATQELICDGLPPDVALRDLGAHRLKDLTRAEQIFQLVVTDLPSDFPSLKSLSAQPDNLPIPPAAPPLTMVGLAPLVGRQAEWEQLQAAWQATAAGGPRLVVLRGEAGIGKTRLAEELLDWAGRQGIVTASARCYAAEGGLVYAPVTTWLRTDAIRASMPALADVWLTDVARLLPELLADRPDQPRPGPLTEAWQRQRLFESLARATQGDGQPRLLLLDDFQWCDAETLAWLHYLLRFDPQARLLLVGTVRSEELASDHPLATLLQSVRRSAQVTEIALGPLDAAGTATLAAHVAGRELDPVLLAHLHHETEGNPLFVVETVRAGALAPTELAHPAVGDTTGPPGPALPPAVQAVLAARLAQLSPAAREVASLAATIGRAFTFTVLARASDADEPTLVRGLDELWSRRIVREQGDDAYDFSHDKLREVAYAALSAARRRLLHRRVAEAVEAVHARDLIAASAQVTAYDEQPAATRLTPIYPLLAYHWRQAGDEAKTIAYLAKAGEQALLSYANQEAVRLLSEALALAAQTELSNDRWQCARWERQMGEAYFGLGQHAEGHVHLERALALLGRPMPTTRRRLLVSLVGQVGRQVLHLAWPSMFVGRKHADQATLLEAARIYERLGQIYYLDNDLLLGLYATVHGFNLAEAGGPSPELARLCANMCVDAGLLPVHILAQTYDRRAKEIARSLNHLPALAWVLEATSVYAIGIGQWAQAREALRQAIEIADRLGDWRRWIENSAWLVVVDILQGALTDAIHTCANIYAMGCRRDDLQAQAWGLAGRAKSLLLMGQFDEAVSVLEVAAAWPTECISRADTAEIYGLLALANLRRGKVALARQATETVAHLIGRARPIAVHALEGYTSLAEVSLALWETSRDQSPAERAALAHAARHACRLLHRYAQVFPIGQPHAWLYRGVHDWLAGKPRKARKAWQKSLAAAEQLAMPYEQGLAHYVIGRHASLLERQHHLECASTIFAQLGAAHDLARAETAAIYAEAMTARD